MSVELAFGADEGGPMVLLGGWLAGGTAARKTPVNSVLTLMLT